MEPTGLVILGDDDFKLEQIKDVLMGKLIKREVPVKNLHFSESEHALGGKSRQRATLIKFVSPEKAGTICKPSSSFYEKWICQLNCNSQIIVKHETVELSDFGQRGPASFEARCSTVFSLLVDLCVPKNLEVLFAIVGEC